MSRHIDLSVYDADPRVMAWLEANDLDPGEVPAAQEVLVNDGQLTCVVFLRGVDGHKVLTERGDGSLFYEKQLRTITLLSAPENHGL